jgi:hypothetical protein
VCGRFDDFEFDVVVVVVVVIVRLDILRTAMASSVPRVKLGSQGLEVSQQGLGCMGMSAFYGPPGPEQEMIDLIHHAVESGVTFIDTADMYGPHTNEILVGKVGNQIPSILVM